MEYLAFFNCFFFCKGLLSGTDVTIAGSMFFDRFFFEISTGFKKSVLLATLGCLQHMSLVITFLSPLKFSQGNSSLHFGLNPRFCSSLACFLSSGLSQLFEGSCLLSSFVCCLCGWLLDVVGGSSFFKSFLSSSALLALSLSSFLNFVSQSSRPG